MTCHRPGVQTGGFKIKTNLDITQDTTQVYYDGPDELRH